MHRLWFVTCVVLAAGCGSSSSDPSPAAATDSGMSDAVTDSHVPSDPVADLRPNECKGPREAPLPSGDGGFRCVLVGADDTAAAAEWPETSSAEAPVVFVRPGATGGDGSKTSPYGTLGAALAATPAARTVVLARGAHVVSSVVKLTGTVTIVGAGANPDGTKGTTLAATTSAFSIEGSTAKVTISGLSISYPATCAPATVGFDASAGSELTLKNVLVSGAGDALRATGSKVTATGFSALKGCSRGIAVLAGSDAKLDSFLVRDGKQIGVVVDDGHVDASTGWIMLNGAAGVSFRGAKSGVASKLSAVAIQCNELTGLTVDGATVEATTLTISDARKVAGAGGDGVVVRGGGSLKLDASIASDAERGFGTQILINARAGLVVSGKGSAVTINGAIVASNGGPGAFVQDGATASIGYGRWRRNVGVGIAATSGGSIVAIQCNELEGTRAGAVDTSAGKLSLLGDALSFSEGSSAAAVTRNELSRNDGFAALFVAATGALVENTGTCNGFPVAGYDGAKYTQDDPGTLPGNSPAPATTPVVAKGQLAL